MRSWISRSARMLALRRGLGLALVVGLAAPATFAQTAPRIVVETPHLGAGPVADRIRTTLPRHLAAELARTGNSLAPPGGRVVIRIREVFLASSELTEDLGGLSMSDAIDGEAIVQDARGGMISRKPVAARSPVSAGGFGPLLAAEARRIDALVETLAYWIARGY